MSNKADMLDISHLTTETQNEKSLNLDTLSPFEFAALMNKEDEAVIQAVRSVLPRIAEAITVCTAALKSGGRIIYIGAGTSGRLGLLDAVECPPTFGVSDTLVIGLIAGGHKAFIKAVEGAEDDEHLAASDLENIQLCAADAVVGLAASGRTPYVIHGLRYAQDLGCKTIAVACNKNSLIGKEASVVIEAVTGPEVLTGSTRLKAGTAQKMILNMISTGSMTGIGKTYGNLMVDLMQTNKKLEVRAQNIVMKTTGCQRERAAAVLAQCGGKTKTAIVMILTGLQAAAAEEALKKADGHIRLVLCNTETD